MGNTIAPGSRGQGESTGSDGALPGGRPVRFADKYKTSVSEFEFGAGTVDARLDKV